MILAGCGGGNPTSDNGQLGHLHGTVTRGPITPVCRVHIPCSQPASGTQLVFISIRTGDETPTTVAGDGSYSVALAPGAYGVTAHHLLSSIERIAPASVHIKAGQTRRVDFRIDTGIR